MKTRIKNLIEAANAKCPSPSEHWEQSMLMIELQRLWTRWPEVGLIYAIPNAGRRSLRTGKMFKDEGLRPGIPDLCLPVPRCPFHGLYVELKRRPYRDKRGRLVKPGPDQEQKRIMAALKRQGYCVSVAAGWEVAKAIIVDYLKLPPWPEQFAAERCTMS